MPQIVFLTLYLGLVSGRQPISVRLDPGIVSVRMTASLKRSCGLTMLAQHQH